LAPSGGARPAKKDGSKIQAADVPWSGCVFVQFSLKSYDE
jgi:hypothetical protein